MGIVGKRKQNEESVQVAGNGQRVWMEQCSRCGCPLTILAVTRPKDPLCTPCQASVAAESSDDSDAGDGRGASGK
jgi:hypothetical protein